MINGHPSDIYSRILISHLGGLDYVILFGSVLEKRLTLFSPTSIIVGWNICGFLFDWVVVF